MKKVISIGYRVLAAAVLLGLTVYFVRALDARLGPPLGPEHRLSFEHEFAARMERETSWSDYLQIEERLGEELLAGIDVEKRRGQLLDRYAPDSISSPQQFSGDWNRSYELRAASPRGAAVMLHGLSDSPYSMMHTAQAAVGSGFNVVVPRLPGHGFAVSGLLRAGWQDWAAAARIAIRHAETLKQPGEPLLLVGYSNGGLLAIDYALRCGDDDSLPCPDRIVMLSPAIAVSPAAAFATLHRVVSWMPYFEKFQWLSVLPEIDPFKFTSFPKQAAWEIRKAAIRTNKLLEDPDKVAQLPPILTFQSVVDNTVRSEAVVHALYDRLPANGSKLVIYDVNRNNTIVHLMRRMPQDPVDDFLARAPLNYDVALFRNRSPQGVDVDFSLLKAGTEEFVSQTTGVDWPLGVYSLSHIAIPFPALDPLYGDGSNSGGTSAGVALGALAPRGELGVLWLTPGWFLRTRFNPFFGQQVRTTSEWLEAPLD